MSKNDKIIRWLEQHRLIKINNLFVTAGMDSGNATRAWSNKCIPERYIKHIEKQLIEYGYK